MNTKLPLSQLWLDELKLIHPELFNKDDHFEWSTLDTFDEYWHIYFNPTTKETILYAQCGRESYTYPAFVEKARLIAQEYYTYHFNNMMNLIGKLVEEAYQNNIAPTLVIIPYFIVKDSYPRHGIREDFKTFPKLDQILGIPFRTHRKNIIRIENPQRHYLGEIPYE